MSEFEKAISKLTAKQKRFTITSGVATDVGDSTCTVVRDGLPDLLDVRYNAIEADIENRFTVKPKEGSHVQCAMIEDTTEAFIIAWSEIESVELVFPEHTMTVNKDGTVWGDGSNGGMVKAVELKAQLDKVTARVNGIIDAIKNGIPVAQDGGVGLQQSIVVGLETLMDVEDFTGIENEKLKH